VHGITLDLVGEGTCGRQMIGEEWAGREGEQAGRGDCRQRMMVCGDGAAGRPQRGRMLSLGCPRPSAIPRRVAAAEIAAPQAASSCGCTAAAAARRAAAASANPPACCSSKLCLSICSFSARSAAAASWPWQAIASCRAQP
jgi:hypothetical protein